MGQLDVRQIGGGDRTQGGDRIGGGVRTGGGVSISYLIVITKLVFFRISNPPLPFQKKSRTSKFYQLRLPLIPEQPCQSFFNMTRKRHIKETILEFLSNLIL